MAKPTFCHGLWGISGKLKGDNMITRRNRETNTFVTVAEPIFQPENRHEQFGVVSINLKSVYLKTSELYREDLSLYSKLLRLKRAGRQKRISNSFMLFTQMMWQLKETYPEINLQKIDLQELLGYPVRSVREAMENRFLEMVKCAQKLDNEM